MRSLSLKWILKVHQTRWVYAFLNSKGWSSANFLFPSNWSEIITETNPFNLNKINANITSLKLNYRVFSTIKIMYRNEIPKALFSWLVRLFKRDKGQVAVWKLKYHAISRASEHATPLEKNWEPNLLLRVCWWTSKYGNMANDFLLIKRFSAEIPEQ